MFRRLEDSLTADSVYPEDLKELGYLITPEHKIRQIKDPKQKFKFRVTNNERHNEMRGEAMNNILREEVMNRMKDLGYVLVNVPPFTIEKPEFPHLPILSTHPDELKAKKRVIIIVGDEQEDLGIWSWRDMLGSSDDSEQEGIEFGSCINFARELKKRAADDEQADGPGLIILNPGQLAFSWKKQKAMTLKSWNHLPRESLSHPSVYLHTDWNLIEGHTTSTEHVQSTFHALLSEPKRLHNDVELYFIGIGSGCGSLLLSIEKYYKEIKDRVAAIQFVAPLFLHDQTINPGHVVFYKRRARALEWSEAPTGLLVGAPYRIHDPKEDERIEPAPPFLTCPTGALSDCAYREGIFPRTYPLVLDWFDEAAMAFDTEDGYANPSYTLLGPPKAAATVSEEP